MKKFNLLCLGLVAGATLAGCSDDTLLPGSEQTEAYVKNFIERYGVPNPNHTFSMANSSNVTVKTSTPTDVCVSAIVGGKEYLFANWTNVSGTQTINFYVPEGVENVIIYANDGIFSAALGETVNLDAPRKAKSRENEVYNYNNTGATYYATTSHYVGKYDDELEKILSPMYGNQRTYFGNIHPVYESGSKWYYDNPNHSVKDANGGKHHFWHSHNYHVTPTQLNQFLLGKGGYSGFKSVNPIYGATTSVPSLYIHYLKKSLDYEMGLMVGNKPKFSESTSFLAIPMYTTEGLTDRNQMLALAQTDYTGMPGMESENNNPYYSGLAVEFYFNQDKDNVVYRFGSTDVHKYTYDFSKAGYSAMKDSILTMYELYKMPTKAEEGETPMRPLPLPIDCASGNMYGGYEGDEEGILQYYEDELPANYWYHFSKYQNWVVKNIILKDENYKEKYSELFFLKEWLAVNDYTKSALLSREDIPVVQQMTELDGTPIEGAYKVSYFNMKRGGGYKAITDGTNDLYTTLTERYIVYQGLAGGVAIPVSYRANQYVYYVKYKGKVITTADGDIKEIQQKWTLGFDDDGQPIYGPDNYGTVYCWDLDGDTDYSDIVFSQSATGSGPNMPNDPYTWIIACEDLGTTGDNDFNDIVVSVKYLPTNDIQNQQVEIRPVAAGGIYPAYLMYNDTYKKDDVSVSQTYFVGPEIHKWLGNETREPNGNLPMINTDDIADDGGLYKSDKVVIHNYKQGFTDAIFHVGMDNLKSSQTQMDDANKSIGGFWVLVDKEGQLEGSNYVTDEYVMREVNLDRLIQDAPMVYEVSQARVDGVTIPMVMVLGSDWEWPKETKRIDLAYKLFGQWITDLKSENEKPIQWYGKDENGRYINDIDRQYVTKRSEISDEIADQEEQDKHNND